MLCGQRGREAEADTQLDNIVFILVLFGRRFYSRFQFHQPQQKTECGYNITCILDTYQFWN